MGATIDTVTVRLEDGSPMHINATDYDPAVHVLYTDEPKGEKPAPKGKAEKGAE